ncbi:hypothetical protein KAT95_00020 [Candidatus Parcubacteria bacterium]|nr:hypothetical protein [Candidatus Parcubacteria bacterium]
MNKKRILISLILFLFIGGICSAEQGMSIFVSPPIFEQEIEPGQSFQDEIYLLNKSDLAIPMEAKVINFEAAGEEGSIAFNEKEADISINPRKWFEIENPYFILEPHQSEKVKFSINVPENAEIGGHYVTVLFEPKLPSFYFEEKTLEAIPQIGVLFLISVGVDKSDRTEKPLTVVEFNIPEEFHLQKLENLLANITGIFSEAWAAGEKTFSIVEKSNLPFTLRIQNNDPYHIKPEGKLLITTGRGKIVGETQVPKTTILPGKTRKFPVEFRPVLPEKLEKYLPKTVSNFISQNLLFGKYKASLLINFENSKIKEDIIFWAFPWKVTLITLFILAILALMRKRIIGAGKALIQRRAKVKKLSTD